MGCVKDTPFSPAAMQAGGLELFLDDCPSLSDLSQVLRHHPCLRKSVNCQFPCPTLLGLLLHTSPVLPMASATAHSSETGFAVTCHGCSFSRLLPDLLSAVFPSSPICSRSLPVKISSLFNVGEKGRPNSLARSQSRELASGDPAPSPLGGEGACACHPHGHKQRTRSQLALSALNLSSRSVPAKKKEEEPPWSLQFPPPSSECQMSPPLCPSQTFYWSQLSL